MEVELMGSTYRVRVGSSDVASFAGSWPCSGLDTDQGVAFSFDAVTGDLVDSNDGVMQPEAEGGALLALSTDAMCFGAVVLGLSEVLAVRRREVANWKDMVGWHVARAGGEG